MSLRLSFSFALFCTVIMTPLGSFAKERSTEEFKDYAARRLAKVDDAKLTEFVETVDGNGDGVITDDEFANRVAAYQKVFQDLRAKAVKRGHGLPENWLTDFDNALEQSQKTGKPIIAMFSASWCGPCKRMIASVFPMDEASKALEDFVPVYIDSEKARELASKNKIRAFPTFKCFTPDGEEAASHVGATDTADFLKLLADFHAAATEKIQEGALSEANTESSGDSADEDSQ